MQKTYKGASLQELLSQYAKDRKERDPEFTEQKETGDKNEVDVDKSPAD